MDDNPLSEENIELGKVELMNPEGGISQSNSEFNAAAAKDQFLSGVGKAEIAKEATTDTTFKAQFEKREQYDFEEGKVEAVDITPEEMTDKTPVIFAPGWMGTFQKHEKTLEAVYNNKRRVVSPVYARRGGKVEGDGKNRKIELQKAGMLDRLIESKQFDKVDAIAQSEGAINILIDAMANPERYRNIVLMNPAGLIGEDNPIAFFKRFQESVKGKKAQVAEATKVLDVKNGEADLGNYTREELEAIREKAKAISSGVTGDIMKNPFRTASELGALADSDIYAMLKDLREKGVSISVIAGVDDKLFPIEKIIDHMNKNRAADGSSDAPLEGFYAVKGGHSEIYSDLKFTTAQGEQTQDTDTERHMFVAIDALNNMQRRRVTTVNTDS